MTMPCAASATTRVTSIAARGRCPRSPAAASNSKACSAGNLRPRMRRGSRARFRAARRRLLRRRARRGSTWPPCGRTRRDRTRARGGSTRGAGRRGSAAPGSRRARPESSRPRTRSLRRRLGFARARPSRAAHECKSSAARSHRCEAAARRGFARRAPRPAPKRNEHKRARIDNPSAGARAGRSDARIPRRSHAFAHLRAIGPRGSIAESRAKRDETSRIDNLIGNTTAIRAVRAEGRAQRK